MRKVLWILLLAFALSVPVRSVEMGQDFLDALPQEVHDAADTAMDADGFTVVLQKLWSTAKGDAAEYLREGVRGMVRFLLVVLLCAMMEGLYTEADKAGGINLSPLAGTLAIAALAAGDMRSLLGLGADAVAEMETFSTVLLPTMASALAASGHTAAASVWQVGTMFFANLLLRLCEGVLLGAVYLYIGVMAADAILPEDTVGHIGVALKNGVGWALKGILALFTGYVTMTNVVTGSSDALAVKAAKSALSGAVPVVGGSLADAAETMLSAAAMLKNSVGLLGMLGVLSICLLPVLRMGIQYLLYKATAAAACVVGSKALAGLINALGGALGLMLGMTASCALLLLISLAVSVSVVTP